jgi:hypothetical protein
MSVYWRIVPIRTLDLLVGGVDRASWLRLCTYIEPECNTHEILALGEWFQWLAKSLEQYPQSQKQLGAHGPCADWRP